jgi:hypothetical protein
MTNKRAPSVSSWHDIPDSVVDEFSKKVRQLQREMIPLDGDGDIAVEIIIVDRRKFEPLHFQPIPYNHPPYGTKWTPEEEAAVHEERLRWLSCNADMANRSLETFLSLELYRLASEREKGAKNFQK